MKTQCCSILNLLSLLFSGRLQHQIKTFAVKFTVGLCLSLLVFACTKNSTNSNSASLVTSDPTVNSERVIRIGYQKSGVLLLVKNRGGLEKRLSPLNVTVQWSEFPSPTPLVEALGAGKIDLGQTSGAGAVSAQAAEIDLVNVANSRPSPKSVAILVPKDSLIRNIADLKGKKVAFNKGSAAHFLVVQALTNSGLKYSDIQPVFLQPPDGRIAFEQGSIDAWAVWDPFLAAAQQSTNARVLVNGEGLETFREFYIASRSFANSNPDVVKQLIAEAQAVGDWAIKHPQEVAKFLALQMKVEVPTLLLAESRKTRYGAQLIQTEALAEQQKVADTFYKLKLIPKPIKVANAAWAPDR